MCPDKQDGSVARRGGRGEAGKGLPGLVGGVRGLQHVTGVGRGWQGQIWGWGSAGRGGFGLRR